MPSYEDTVRAWSDGGDEPTQLLPVTPPSGGTSRQVWIVAIAAAAGVLAIIALGFLLLVPEKTTVPPLVPITSVTTPSTSAPVSSSLSPSAPPSSTETVTETVTATTYLPAPAITPTTDAPPSTTATDPNDIWRACRQMHPHRWCSGYR